MTEVKHPSHYIAGPYECKKIEKALSDKAATYKGLVLFLTPHQWRLWFAAFEYLWRAPWKNGRQDIEKCIQDLTYLLEEMEEPSALDDELYEPEVSADDELQLPAEQDGGEDKEVLNLWGGVHPRVKDAEALPEVQEEGEESARTVVQEEDFDWDAFFNRMIVANCRTHEAALRFLAECSREGIEWYGGVNATHTTNWGVYQEETCYMIDNVHDSLVFLSTDYHSQRYSKLKLVEYK